VEAASEEERKSAKGGPTRAAWHQEARGQGRRGAALDTQGGRARDPLRRPRGPPKKPPMADEPIKGPGRGEFRGNERERRNKWGAGGVAFGNE